MECIYLDCPGEHVEKLRGKKYFLLLEQRDLGHLSQRMKQQKMHADWKKHFFHLLYYGLLK